MSFHQVQHRCTKRLSDLLASAQRAAAFKRSRRQTRTTSEFDIWHALTHTHFILQHLPIDNWVHMLHKRQERLACDIDYDEVRNSCLVDQPGFGIYARALLDDAAAIFVASQDWYIDIEHLFHASARQTYFTKMMEQHGVQVGRHIADMRKFTVSVTADEAEERHHDEGRFYGDSWDQEYKGGPRSGHNARLADEYSKWPTQVVNEHGDQELLEILTKQCWDLTKRADTGMYSHLVGREAECEDIISLLTDGERHSILLHGPTGSGKNSLVHMVAREMAHSYSGNLRRYRFLKVSFLHLHSYNRRETSVGEARGWPLILEVERAREAGVEVVLVVNVPHPRIDTQDWEDCLTRVNSLVAGTKIQLIACVRRPEIETIKQLDGFHFFGLKPASAGQTLGMIQTHLLSMHAKTPHPGISIQESLIRQAIQISHQHYKSLALPASAIEIMNEAIEIARACHGAPAGSETDNAASVMPGMTSEPAPVPRTKRLDPARCAVEVGLGHLHRAFARKCGIHLSSHQADCECVLFEDYRLDAYKAHDQPHVFETIRAARKASFLAIEPPTKPVSFLFSGIEDVSDSAILAWLPDRNMDQTERAGIADQMDRRGIARGQGEYIAHASDQPRVSAGLIDGMHAILNKLRVDPRAMVVISSVEKCSPTNIRLLTDIISGRETYDQYGTRIHVPGAIFVFTTEIGSHAVSHIKDSLLNDPDISAVHAGLRRVLDDNFLDAIGNLCIFTPRSDQYRIYWVHSLIDPVIGEIPGSRPPNHPAKYVCSVDPRALLALADKVDRFEELSTLYRCIVEDIMFALERDLGLTDDEFRDTEGDEKVYTLLCHDKELEEEATGTLEARCGIYFKVVSREECFCAGSETRKLGNDALDTISYEGKYDAWDE